ncbi:MAG: c-type cytochrome [Xanthomonadales bacterium]|nr:c-type cytochrome [Xanthomonadales bacterium]
MEEQTDKVFIKNVSIVLVLLVVFTIGIAILARDVGFKDDSSENPSRETTTEERIRPVADVFMGEAGAAAIEEAAASSETEMKIAFDGSLDGEMIYDSVCGVCHATGAAGAPIPGSALMTERAGKGLDALTQSAINGLNAMPPRGGRADLSDEQVRVIVEYMIQ